MSKTAIQNEETVKRETVSWSELLGSKPPGVWFDVNDMINHGSQIISWTVKKPDLQLYCDADLCEGIRFFEAERNEECPGLGSVQFFLNYHCRNCNSSSKAFAVEALIRGPGLGATVVKVGEHPPFGPSTPARLISMIGPDRDVFLKGRRAESQGLGIGAFAYYRRVVENQKGRIIGQIEVVAHRLGANEETLQRFKRAQNEPQFTNAIEAVKDSIPQSLLIDSHNPLTLLHSALSEGLHAQTDEECLEIASSIRVVMTELAERISTALKDQAELKHAVSRLLNRRKPKAALKEDSSSSRS